jgi:hypothetical protein
MRKNRLLGGLPPGRGGSTAGEPIPEPLQQGWPEMKTGPKQNDRTSRLESDRIKAC